MAEENNYKSSSIQLKMYLKNVNHNLISHAMYLFIIPCLLIFAIHNFPTQNINQENIIQLYNNANYHLHGSIAFLTIFTFLIIYYFIIFPKKVYLVDFSCYKHDPSYLHSKHKIFELASNYLSPESLAFFKKVVDKSGVSEDTYFYGDHNDIPPKYPFDCGRKEAETVICGAVDDLLAKTGVNTGDIGIVIVNISLFNQVPSLWAMIVNRYKLREDVLSYNLGGMGCSTGVIAVDLAKRFLQVQCSTYALIMSLESITANNYLGDDRSKLVAMSLFRMGGAAILLSNGHSDRWRSKYQLKHTLRTHRGANDRVYKCMYQEKDKDGKIGLTLSKDLMYVAGEALKSNITALGPLVLPLSEQLVFHVTFMARKIFKSKKISPYVPDFKLAFEHFCIHAGGKAVLDEIEKNLNLTDLHMEPSRMTLYRFGNTSSSSLWYELAHTEAKGRVQKGDRVWQIAFGSGFKCNSAVWRALKNIDPTKEQNPWTDVIDQFPCSYMPT